MIKEDSCAGEGGGFALDEERRKRCPEFFFLVNEHFSPGAGERRCRDVYVCVCVCGWVG